MAAGCLGIQQISYILQMDLPRWNSMRQMLFCLEDVMYVCCMYGCVYVCVCMLYVLYMYLIHVCVYNTIFLPVPTSMQIIFLKEVRNPSSWVKKRLLSQPRLLTKIQ